MGKAKNEKKKGKKTTTTTTTQHTSLAETKKPQRGKHRFVHAWVYFVSYLLVLSSLSQLFHRAI